MDSDIWIKIIMAVQAVLLALIGVYANRHGKQAAVLLDAVDEQVVTSLLATQNAMQEVTTEVLHARQEQGELLRSVENLATQMIAVRGELATLSDTVSRGQNTPTK